MAKLFGFNNRDFVLSWMATDELSQSLTNLTKRLLNEEQMKIRHSTEFLALVTSSKSWRGASSSGKRGDQSKARKNQKDKPKLSRQELLDLKSKSSCHLCKKKGHWRDECPGQNEQAGKSEIRITTMTASELVLSKPMPPTT